MKLKNLPGVSVSCGGRLVAILSDVTVAQAEAAWLDGANTTTEAGILKALGDRFEAISNGRRFAPVTFDLGAPGTYSLQNIDRAALRGNAVTTATDRPGDVPATAGESHRVPISPKGGEAAHATPQQVPVAVKRLAARSKLSRSKKIANPQFPVVRAWREHRGLTVAELCRRAKIDDSVFYTRQWTPFADEQISGISRALDVSVETLDAGILPPEREILPNGTSARVKASSLPLPATTPPSLHLDVQGFVDAVNRLGRAFASFKQALENFNQVALERPQPTGKNEH